ncbi:MAG: hypothetical protein K2K84_10260 [Muribaculaceae bacterium]|nr:hypothetical protein [Muribaculaceae bacterium]
MELKFEEIIREKAPALTVALIEADINNPETDDALWAQIETVARRIKDSYEMEMVNKRPAIAATRTAYKAFGKEPNRYRPSAEALTRRAVKGLELYRTLAVIDLVNLVSLATGHSIGAFDADQIKGGVLTLGVGHEGEPYEAIGRGQLNIHGLPVWRDEIGGVGTPTSDNDRTKLSPVTQHLVMTVNMYSAEPSADETVGMLVELLERYASATNIQTRLYSVS